MLLHAASLLLLGATAAASEERLLKPALTSSLNYLSQGDVEHLPTVNFTVDYWDDDYIPYDCKTNAQQQGLQARDISVYNVTYADCEDPWVVCHHRRSPVPLDTFLATFSRVPVGMRDWVRHVSAFPADEAFAYNEGGSIYLFDTAASDTDVHLHESTHSLDMQGALTGSPDHYFSDSATWMDAYDMNDFVPDDYAQTDQLENFAQTGVLAVYDRAVPGGFAGLQPRYRGVEAQYKLLEEAAGDAITSGGRCNRHLAPSQRVKKSSVFDYIPPSGGDPSPVRLPKTNLTLTTGAWTRANFTSVNATTLAAAKANDARTKLGTWLRVSNPGWFKGNYPNIVPGSNAHTKRACRSLRKRR